MKLKIMLVIVVTIILVMNLPVYATYIPDPPSDAWEYWVIYKNRADNIIFASSHNPITVKIEPYNEKYVNLLNNKRFIKMGNEWVFQGEEDTQEYREFRTFYQANHDIAYEDESGFFFLRPKVLRLYPTTTTTDFGTILRTFSAGLIPLIGLLILAVSLQKAWAFLQSQLRS